MVMARLLATWGGSFALTAMLAQPVVAQEQPSFSCNSVSLEAEVTICDSDRLSRMDRRMADLYQSARDSVGWFKRRTLKNEQRDWLTERNACDTDQRCLRRAYRARIDALSQYASDGASDEPEATTFNPSFSCTTTNNDAEKEICGSRRLARLDRELDELYREKSEAAETRRIRRRMRDDQKDWIVSRNECGATRRCLRQSYEQRIATLNEPVRRRPGYQRTAAWQELCDGETTDTTRVICESEGLFKLNSDVASVYASVRDGLNRRRDRRKLRDQQSDWQERLQRCGERERCIQRRLTARIETLRQSARPDYQRTARWEKVCGSDATRDQRLICDNENLWSANSDVGAQYAAARERLNRRRDRRELKANQDAWFASLADCRGRQNCLLRQFRQRSDVLAKYSAQPAFQRTAAWERACSSNTTPTQRVICDAEVLWNAQTDVASRYQSVRERLNRRRDRRDLKASQDDWRAALANCRQSQRCLLRQHRDRADVLANYRPSRPKPDYQRTAAWRAACVDKVPGVAQQVTCTSERLWGLHQKVWAEFNEVKGGLRRSGSVNRLNTLHNNQWRLWKQCRERVNCQARAYRGWYDAIRDFREGDGGQDPVADQPVRLPFQNTQHWVDFCRGVRDPAIRMICERPRLWNWHLDMRKSYSRALRRAAVPTRPRIRNEQAKWGGLIKLCGANPQCVITRHRQRITILDNPQYILPNGIPREKREDNSR